jgi:hypothetical protein
MKCNVCGHEIEDRGYKHTQCRFCGQISNLCCDPEAVCVVNPGIEQTNDTVDDQP